MPSWYMVTCHVCGKEAYVSMPKEATEKGWVCSWCYKEKERKKAEVEKDVVSPITILIKENKEDAEKDSQNNEVEKVKEELKLLLARSENVYSSKEVYACHTNKCGYWDRERLGCQAEYGIDMSCGPKRVMESVKILASESNEDCDMCKIKGDYIKRLEHFISI
jgi:hypothetical protein